MEKDPNGKPSIDAAEPSPTSKPEELQSYRMRRAERWAPKPQSIDESTPTENVRLKQ